MAAGEGGGPRRNGQRYVQLPAELLDRARAIPELDASAVCRVAVEAACDAIASGEARTVTFGYVERVVRTLEIQSSLAYPPKPEEQ